MRDSLADVREHEQAGPSRVMSWAEWLEWLELRPAEDVWMRVWRRMGARPIVVLQPWPEELAREWLGLAPPEPRTVPPHVATLLRIASPLLAENT